MMAQNLDTVTEAFAKAEEAANSQGVVLRMLEETKDKSQTQTHSYMDMMTRLDEEQSRAPDHVLDGRYDDRHSDCKNIMDSVPVA